MRYITTFVLCAIFTMTAHAQFKPGDIGYDPSMQQPFATMKVKTQLQTMVDENGWATAYALHSYGENGWLLETEYLQDSTLAPEERSPDMKDYYTYYPDGRIRVIEMEGYDLLTIKYGFEYDKKNRLTASVIASAEAREYSYTHDKQGHVISRTGKGGRWVYADENDTEGKLTMVTLENTEYQWDDNGRLTGETLWYMNEWTNRTAYAYNDKGQLASMAVYHDNSDNATPAFLISYTYDQNGLLSNSVIREDGYEVTYLYTYTYY